MYPEAKVRNRGISIIEALLALGVLGVFLSFASSSLSTAAARADLRAAAENMEYSAHMAKNAARQLETDVIMHLHSDSDESGNSVTFTYPARQPMSGSPPLLQDFQFPESVRLVSDMATVHFDSRGVVEVSTPILLVSKRDDDMNQVVVIE